MVKKTLYVIFGWAYYLITIVIVGGAMVLLVQGFLNQWKNDLVMAFIFYIGTVFLAGISLFFFREGHKKLLIAESSP